MRREQSFIIYYYWAEVAKNNVLFPLSEQPRFTLRIRRLTALRGLLFTSTSAESVQNFHPWHNTFWRLSVNHNTALISQHSSLDFFFLFWRRRVSRKMHQCHAALGLRPHDFFLFSFLHYPGLNYHVTIMNPFRRQARLLWALSQALIHPAHQSRSSFFLLPFFQPLLVSFYLPETYNELHPVNSAEEERQHQSLLSSITMVFLSTSPIGRSDDGMLSYQKRLPGQEVFCKPSLTVQERTENEH